MSQMIRIARTDSLKFASRTRFEYVIYQTYGPNRMQSFALRECGLWLSITAVSNEQTVFFSIVSNHCVTQQSGAGQPNCTRPVSVSTGQLSTAVRRQRRYLCRPALSRARRFCHGRVAGSSDFGGKNAVVVTPLIASPRHRRVDTRHAVDSAIRRACLVGSVIALSAPRHHQSHVSQ